MAMTEMEKEFHIARALAIDAYARFEGSLLFLYSHLLGTPIDYAGVTFYKINNAPARLQIIERLLKKRQGTTYKKFWDSLNGRFRTLDDTRNHVVHWKAIRPQKPTGEVTDILLIPPNFLDKDENTPKLVRKELEDFSVTCDSYCHVLSMFYIWLNNPERHDDASRDIFQESVPPDPIPTTHPLYRNY